MSERQKKDWPGCPMCARLQRYADTAWNRGHTMGMKANEDTARQAMDALRAEKAAHADTNAMLTASLLEAEKTRDELAEVLAKINDIRNCIVGTQTINWSEHVYPLVAALNAAGIEGMPYPEARKYFGSMLERTVKAEKSRAELAEALREARKYIYYRGLGTDDVTVYGDNPPFIEAVLDPIDALLARIDAKQKEPAK